MKYLDRRQFFFSLVGSALGVSLLSGLPHRWEGTRILRSGQVVPWFHPLPLIAPIYGLNALDHDGTSGAWEGTKYRHQVAPYKSAEMAVQLLKGLDRRDVKGQSTGRPK